MSFSGNDKYGVYHSIYDSFYWMDRFGDPDYKFHKTMAQFWGLAAMRMASSKILPFDYNGYGLKLKSYRDNVFEVAKAQNISLDIHVLDSAISKFCDASSNIGEIISSIHEDNTLNTDSLKLINGKLYLTERMFLDSKGLKGRHWFKHLIQAPGLDTGYGAVVFPGITDAIEHHDSSEANIQLIRLSENIARASEYLRATVLQYAKS
jgi:N-acetylated-alpha-linked acidic dipeptidase